jgi:hypothetical protein
MSPSRGGVFAFDPPGRYDDEEPFSDDEREEAGLPPIGTGPPPRESAGDQRRRLKATYRAQQQDLATGSRSSRPSSSSPSSGAGRSHRSRRNQASGIFSKATGGAKAIATGKWGGVSPAGLLLGFVLWAACLNLLEGGPDQLGKWMGAKFVNKQYAAPTASTPSTPASTEAVTV